MADETPILPAHIEDTVRAIAQVHAAHHEGATPLQRLVEHATAFVGRPAFIGILTTVVVAWVLLNLNTVRTGGEAWDAPPFPWLQGAISLIALCTTILVLITQRKDDELATHREQLTLELAILSEQKTAKIIELLEEMRRDSPFLRTRVDLEAEALSVPADPQSVLDAIKDSQKDFSTIEQVTGDSPREASSAP